MSDISAICNLSAEDRESRGVELREVLAPKARRREELPDGVALFFDPTPEMRSELEAFVAFETECCPSLGFSVRDEAGGLRLEITGIDPSAGFLADVGFSEISEMPAVNESDSGGWRRLARSAGLGAIGAFVLFCVVPMGLVALLGAQFAATLGSLDNPWAIGAGTLFFAGLLWRWEHGRAAARASAASCGC